MKRLAPLAMSVALALLAMPASAVDERHELEMLRETTLNLIDTLVEAGVLSREQADGMLAKARRKAAQTIAEKPLDESTIRVTYVPESVRQEIREQIKKEVVSQAQAEGWAQADAVPGWIKRIKVEGDIRLRYQTDNMAEGNTPAADYVLAAQNGATRAASFATVDGNGVPAANTLEDIGRWRVRARLGVLADVTDHVSAGLRLSTGNTRDRVSTNQTLGQNLNKYDFLVERAYVKLQPVSSVSLTGGRIPNPWYSTDLMWDTDLNFEGVAASWQYKERGARFRPFATVGYFPIRADDPPSAPEGRSLVGAQVGAGWDVAPWQQLRFGVALYDFRQFEGKREPSSALGVSGANQIVLNSDYGSTRYESGLRQKGNTLFETNASNDISQPIYFGLASKFRPLNLTGAWVLDYWHPAQVVLSADYVYNTAFDKREIERRTGLDVSDASANAWRLGISVGQAKIEDRGDWQASIAYKRVGSDALLDAFTDSDFGGGGTNLRGFVLGFGYGLDHNTALGLKYASADTIASPTLRSGDAFGQDTLQFDLAVKF